MQILFLGNIKAFISTNAPMHSFSIHMWSFVFFLKKFRVSNCFIVGFTHLAFEVISSAIYLRFDVVTSNALALNDSGYLFKWPFQNQFQDFTSALSSVFLMNWSWGLFFFQSCFFGLPSLGVLLLLVPPDDLHAAEMSFS